MRTERAFAGKRAVLCVIAAIAVALAVAPAVASAWAPVNTAKIRPGIQTYTRGAQCTANFVFKRNDAVFLGQAAHCAGKGSATDTNGCEADSYPLGTEVRLQGANTRGTIVYSSWIAMHRAKEKSANACAYNDLTLIKLKARDVSRTNPTVPGFGGPEGVGTARSGDTVYTYGNSSLRPGGTPHKHQGPVISRMGGGWSYKVKTVPEGVPGDSGSPFLNPNGAALGVLSTLEVLPCASCNGVGDIGHELAYARNHGFSGLRVVDGTRPFRPGLAGSVLGR